MHADELPTQVDGEDECKVVGIEGYRERNGKMWYLMSFAGYDASEDMRLNTMQLEHIDELL